MKAENTLLKSTNPQLEFKKLKTLFERSDISEEHCYLAFQKTLNIFSIKDDELSSVNLKAEMLKILLLLQEKHEPVYDRVVNDFSSLIIRAIQVEYKIVS